MPQKMTLIPYENNSLDPDQHVHTCSCVHCFNVSISYLIRVDILDDVSDLTGNSTGPDQTVRICGLIRVYNCSHMG